jgi:DNA helicase-2/ATP-dependent DNA helicase PcrA
LLKDLNPSQVEAVTQPLVLRNDHGLSSTSVVTRVIAGPGSGKTKVLTTRIAYLLNEDPYGRVLAVTFTRKAAGEMRERLERLLSEQESISGSGGSDGGHHEDLEPARIVQEHANGRKPDDSNSNSNSNPPMGMERVELGTFHSICAKILRFNGDLLRDLPSVQRDMSQAQPVWVEQLPRGRDDENENDDDDEDDGGKPERVLVDPEINLNGQYAIVDQAEQIRIINECLKQQKIDLKQTDLKPIQILTAIGKMKESFAQGNDPFANTNKKGPGAALRTARKIYYPYRERLLTNNAVDFDDLILLTRELLKEDDELRERLHKRWRHVLVDEYQDTSLIQMDLVKLLTSSSLFVVGDADQSIYSWRGAHAGSLEDVSTEFSAFGSVRTVFLKENYRSTSNIVRAAEKVISSGQAPLPPRATDHNTNNNNNSNNNSNNNNLSDQSTAQDDLRRAMKPKRGAGPSPRVVACEDERAEAKFVVDTILNMTAHGDISDGNTVAMIYRTNAQSRYLEEACVQQNLPYVIRGGAGGFYKRAEIKDCLCFLRWLHNGNDEGSMVRAMKTPSKGIGEKAYREFKEYCEKVQTHLRRECPDLARPTFLDVLVSLSQNDGDAANETAVASGDYVLPEGAPLPQDHITKRALNNFLKFSAKMRTIRSKAHTEPVGKLLLSIIDDLELMGHFDAISKSRTEFNERKENVQELRNAAKKYASYGPSLGDPLPSSDEAPDEDDEVFGVESALASFLDDVALVSDIGEANAQEEGASNRLLVNLMTIHASKGTEFDCVFVVGLEEGTLPCNPALQEGPGSVQLEEEKRLCYVAMTRAKTRLILTWRKEVTGFSNWSDSGPKTQKKQRSRFLNAIVSKKSLKDKTKKKTKPTTAGSTPGASPRSFSTRAAQSAARPNRSGLRGPEGGRRRSNLDPGRRSPLRRERPANASRTPPPRRTPSSSTRRAQPTPSVERIEALRSSLEAPSIPGGTPPPPPRRSPPPPPKTSNPVRRNVPPTPARSSPQQDVVDPMWFFPVGKKVVHRNLGKGTVLEPPPFDKVEDAKVRVRFENGSTLEFPALGSDILPDMGNF